MINREQALQKLEAAGFDETLRNHALETEAVLRGLAVRLEEDEDTWGLTGLLHDLDFPETKESPERHGLLAADQLADGLPQESLQAIKAHNAEMNGSTAVSHLDFALRCGETVTGLVSASALVRPEGMTGMKPKSLKKKMKDKSFAANVSRERLRDCEQLGLELGEFLQIAIDSIEAIADQVGLAKQ